MEWSWLKSCIFIKQHRWPLRGIKWNHLSTPRNALQDAGGAAALCVTEVTGWGARGAAVDVHKFCRPRFPERKQSQEKNVPEEQRLTLLHHHRASLTATAANSPAETMEALSGAGQRCPLVTVCWHPGTRSQLPPHSWITASSPLRACAPRVLLVPPQGKHCPLYLCLFFLSQGFGLVPSRREEIPRDPRVLHPLMIVFHQEPCHGPDSDLFFKTEATKATL